MATIAEFGEDGWPDYWSRLRDNGVEVVDDWEPAYYERFSGASDGPKPLVVSYGTSPPAEVVFADPPIDAPTTAVVDTTCFRQVEFAGVLRGTDADDEARQLVDFLLSETFQAELPLNLFVYPANADVALPDVFTEQRHRPRATRRRSTRRRSPPTARPGSTSGPTPSCADPSECCVHRSAWCRRPRTDTRMAQTLGCCRSCLARCRSCSSRCSTSGRS